MTETSRIYIAQAPRLPCKWVRPLNDMYVGCWNKKKIRKHIDDDVGVIPINTRPYCRGEVDDIPECWEGLKQKCIDQCEHYWKGTSKFNKLKGFCDKQCKNLELFAQKKKHEILYKDFDDLDIIDIIKLSDKRS